MTAIAPGAGIASGTVTAHLEHSHQAVEVLATLGSRNLPLESAWPCYAAPMARYVIDAPTLLHLVDAGLYVNPRHQLVAPNSIRSEALELLLHEVRAGTRAEAAALEAHERMTEVKLRLLGDRVSRRRAWEIARQHQWGTLGEAEYRTALLGS